MQAEIHVERAALRTNIAAIKALAAPARFIAVVKADAYGHGLLLVVPAIADIVDAFGVYEVSEAVAIRALGVTKPIHILGAVPPSEFDDALHANAIIPLWNNGAWRRDLLHACHRLERQAQVQIKVDSGLTRLGIRPVDAAAFLAGVRAENAFELVGAYSHLASAEELDSRYTNEQLANFASAIPPGSVPQRHIAASAAAMLWSQTRLDAVRVGIAMYGLWPSEASRARLQNTISLRPALKWFSHLISVHDVAAETPVGYGSTYRPATDTRIGVMPIGYAEGLPRSLSNNGTVLIDGRRCAIVGRICMNMTFIDLTNAPQAQVGSRVTMIGNDGMESLSADTLALHAGTISYEIVSRLPPTILRNII